MAEENQSSRTTFEDMALALFAILLVGNMMNRLPGVLEENFGISLGSEYLVASAAVGVNTPLGARVNTPQSTAYQDAPGPGGLETGTFKPGTSLVLRGGPKVMPSGERWWYVEDLATGVHGWIPESAMVREGAGGLTKDTKLGTKVRALVDVDTWKVPGGLDKLGSLVKGERGILVDGPTVKNGSRWWFFDAEDSNTNGWVTEAALLLAGENDWQEGSKVKAVRATDMYERAGGGRAIGFLTKEERATVIGGPLVVDGVYWWLVENERGAQGWVTASELEDAGFRGWARGVIGVLLVVGTLFTVTLLGGIVYATIRTNQIRVRESKRIKDAIPKAMQPKRNERWDKVIEHISSENPNDWRLAIIEADVMLDELITRMGYLGTTLGDKLKQVARGDVQSIDAAWEAHRMRNQVAHEGSDFILTQHEAQRAINLYSAVFEEFKYI